MKYILLVLSVMLFGCAQTPPPTSMNTTDWQSFGEEMALKGKTKQTEASLAEAASSPSIDADLYAAYDQGYEVGKTQYCSQNPRALGRRGETYLGICDDVDKWFRFSFERGAESKYQVR
ncbi:DUF2799 domain-containing protein [Vibrio splendidus]|uniref:DUF2799 domain-containing protein n=1 Tax=Vibrio splendidus TaxID=29497 RepID=UPI000318A11C|nr:DUF2799 domain-containing protein [Vibrio splendidus]OEF30282.1 hypothetical protein A150_04025 [Vibrio splendidus 1S-124]PTQ15540.1 DUF2799 domain-containing protein [Vibrio splendidus]